MNKTYLRLFLSIISITIVVLLAEIMYFVASTVIIDRRWKAQVFTQYMTSFHEKVGERSYPATAFTLFSELMDSAPDRVSGVLLRDSEGRPMLSVGRTGRGEYIPQLKRGAVIPNEFRIENVSFPPEFSISVESTRNVERIRINRPKVIFEADTSVVGRDVVINDLRIYASGDKGKMFVEMPEGVESSDIAGTIAFVENDREIGYLDIIVFDVGFYGPTYMLIRQITNMFLLFLPVALLFSFIAGYFISKNNTKMLSDIKASLSRLERGEYGRKIEMSRINVDEMREIAKSIESLDEDLMRHSRSRREWFKNISHDLNTPVTGINLLLSGALDGVFPLDRALIEKLKEENDSLMARISSISFYSTLQDRKKSMEKANIDLFNFADSILLGRKDVLFDASPSVEFNADWALASRALKEVLDNAEEYKSGGPVRWVVTKENGSTVMRISNDGHLPNPLPQFFEPWARGDGSRHEGGSGLGLPICHQIMELHGGSVAIDENGSAVTVTLRFPL